MYLRIVSRGGRKNADSSSAGCAVSGCHSGLPVRLARSSAQLEFEEPAGQAWCMACSRKVLLAARGMACTQCGSYPLQFTDGTELRVIDMWVTDE